MRLFEGFRQISNTLKSALGSRYEETGVLKVKGEVFMTLRDGASGVIQDKRHVKNVVTLDASILVARLVKDNSEPPFGAFALAVGTGAPGWDLQNPPAPTNTQRSLWSELSRKTFASTQFVDANGVPAAYPTNLVDFTTTFSESEAVGPLVEMGIIGGNVSTNLQIRNPVLPPNGAYNPTVDLTTRETLLNFLSFKVVNKPPTSTLSIVWRLSF